MTGQLILTKEYAKTFNTIVCMFTSQFLFVIILLTCSQVQGSLELFSA